MLRSEVAEVVGLTADRWETVLIVLAVVLFTCGVLIAEKL